MNDGIERYGERNECDDKKWAQHKRIEFLVKSHRIRHRDMVMMSAMMHMHVTILTHR